MDRREMLWTVAKFCSFANIEEGISLEPQFLHDKSRRSP